MTVWSHGSLNAPIEHHPTIRYMVYSGYYKVMSNIPKMGQLPTPGSHLNWPNATCQEKDTHAKIKNLYELLLVSSPTQKPSFWGWNQGIVASLHPTRVTSEVSSHFQSVLNSKFHSKRKTSLAQLSETNYCGWKKSCTIWWCRISSILFLGLPVLTSFEPGKTCSDAAASGLWVVTAGLTTSAMAAWITSLPVRHLGWARENGWQHGVHPSPLMLNTP